MGTILWGILMIVAGASGQFVLRGTNSSGALMAFGGVLIVVGIFGMIGKKSTDEQAEQQTKEAVERSIADSERLAAPCRVMVIRDKKMTGVGVNYEMSLNGEPVGTLKNGTTLGAETELESNLLTAPNLPKDFRFRAVPGGVVRLKLRTFADKEGSMFDVTVEESETPIPQSPAVEALPIPVLPVLPPEAAPAPLPAQQPLVRFDAAEAAQESSPPAQPPVQSQPAPVPPQFPAQAAAPPPQSVQQAPAQAQPLQAEAQAPAPSRQASAQSQTQPPQQAPVQPQAPIQPPRQAPAQAQGSVPPPRQAPVQMQTPMQPLRQAPVQAQAPMQPPWQVPAAYQAPPPPQAPIQHQTRTPAPPPRQAPPQPQAQPPYPVPAHPPAQGGVPASRSAPAPAQAAPPVQPPPGQGPAIR